MNLSNHSTMTSPQTPNDANDAALMDLIATDDEAAFERLVTQHGGPMMSVASRFFRSEQDTADAMQDALICVFRYASGFEAKSKLSTWLHRITVNACLMKLRSQRRRQEVEIDDLLPTFDETGHHTHGVAAWRDDDGSPATIAERAETRDHVRACIDQLPESYRSVLVLRDIEQVDTEEAAQMLNCSTACVKTRLHRARQALRTLLAPRFEREEMMIA